MPKATLEEVLNESLWCARMEYGMRYVGTYKQVEKYGKDERCKDIDTLCTEGQPAKLQPFWKAYWDYMDNHKTFMTIQQFYPIWEAGIK